jgi:hypoxanthine phosphoribosyltransferase
MKTLFATSDIKAAVALLSEEISRDYADKNPILIGVLKGSFIFMADLVRMLDFALEIDFVNLSSYGDGTHSCGNVKMDRCYRTKLTGRHVLVVDDIVDTGLTLHFLFDHIQAEKPASLRLCALLDKPSRRKLPVKVDYLGFTIPDYFVVGYGLDCAQKYRNLPYLSCLEEGDPECD